MMSSHSLFYLQPVIQHTSLFNNFFSCFFFSGVVYLQYGDEIKRAMLPAGLQDMSQVQTLFTQTFPDKVKRSGDNRKTIYIKDNSCGVFYELDSVG